MTNAEIRLACLRMAMELGGGPDDIIANAAKLFAYVTNSSGAGER